jgi:16S rRNA (guanine527-N7)-methyltransferase
VTTGAALPGGPGTIGGTLSRQREPLPTRVDGLPDLPPEYGRVLDAGLRRLGLRLSADARRQIDDHVRLLLAWTGSINLTAIRGPADVARRHVLDSLAGAPVLERLAVRRFVDLGSGGGFPGLPLAAALPGTQALLVESVAKKADFLATVSRAVGLADRVSVAAARAEALAEDPAHRGAWPAVVVRAVGALADSVELAFPLLSPGGHLIAWKRNPPPAELAAARRAAAVLGGGRLRIEPAGVEGLPEHVLVVAELRSTAPPAYPREPALRKHRPW